MGRSTFDGPILSGDNRFGPQRDVGPVLLAQQAFLEKWMSDQIGPHKLWEQIKAEAPLYAKILPALPRLFHDFLKSPPQQLRSDLNRLIEEQRKTNSLMQRFMWAVIGFVGGILLMQYWIQST